MKETIIREIRKYHPGFSEEALQTGLDLFELKQFKAKDIILQAGQKSEYLFFAESAISRCFYLDEDQKEQTLWIKPEQTFITEYKSFVSQTSSTFSLQFYEDTPAYCIRRDQLLRLYQESKDWALFGVHLTEALHVILIDVFVNLLANDATQNYRYIEYMFPRFIQVAPLKDIASMLQISPVSLSRIRAGTQTKS